MTTAGSASQHGGGYQNYSFNELWEFIQTNPNKGLRLNKSLKSVGEIISDPSTHTSTALGINGMRFNFLKPSGLLSVFTWISSPMFREAPINLANTMRREYGTQFLNELDTKISGTRFLRKKRLISEWINTLINLPGILTKDIQLAVSTLCEIQGYHAILVSDFSTNVDTHTNDTTVNTNCEQHTQIFFSSDPAEWTSYSSVWIFDINGSWILENNQLDTETTLSTWIEDKEKDGWVIHWPSIDPDVKKTDMVETLKQSITWKDGDEKLKKDVLAPRYIRYRVLKALRENSLRVGK